MKLPKLSSGGFFARPISVIRRPEKDCSFARCAANAELYGLIRLTPKNRMRRPATCSGPSSENGCRRAKSIDWSIPGKSIFNRERPLADKTMKRVWAGFKKFALPQILARYGSSARILESKPDSGAFLVKLKGTGTATTIRRSRNYR
jgi:hypothetical protein